MKRMAIVAALTLLTCAAGFAQSMMSTDTTQGDASSMMAPDAAQEEMTARELRLAPGTGGKVIYTTLAAAQTLARKGPVVLFFSADWCPTCIEAMKDINANGKKLKDVTIVMVDYDTEKELKKQYGVRVQHTFVQVDAAGGKRGIWNGGGVDEVLKRVARS